VYNNFGRVKPYVRGMQTPLRQGATSTRIPPSVWTFPRGGFLEHQRYDGTLGASASIVCCLGCLWQLRKLWLSLCKHLFMSNLTFDSNARWPKDMEGETPCARAPKDTEQVKVTATGDGWRVAVWTSRNMSKGRWARTCPCYTWLSRRWVRRNAF